MAVGYGFAGHIGIAPEASGGVPVAAADYMYALSETLHAERQRFDVVNIAGRYAEPDDEAGLTAVGGDLVMAVNPISIGWPLAGIMDASSVSDVLSGFMWTHAAKMRTSDWDNRFPNKPVTIETYRDVTSSQQYGGLNFSRLQFTLAPNAPLQVTAGLVGITHSNIAKTSPTFPGSPLGHYVWDAASVALAGTASALFEALSVTIDHQIQAVPTLANRNTSYKLRRGGPVMVRVGGTVGFEDITEYLNFLNQAEQAMKLTVTEPASFMLSLSMPRVVYSAFPLGTQGRDRRTVQFEGIARYSTTSLTALEAIFTSTKSFYM